MEDSQTKALPDELKEKLRAFRVRGEDEEGLRFLKEIDKAYLDNLEVLVYKVLYLYHHILNNEEYEPGDSISNYPKLEEAEKLAESILERVDKDSNTASTARMAIFQIHSFLQNKETAYKYAKENWDRNKNSTAANRMRWLYLNFDEIKKAREWHDIFIKKAENEGGWKKYHLLSEEIQMLLAEDKKEEAKDKYEDLLPLLPDNDEGEAIERAIKKALPSKTTEELGES